jgi:hypothetical protein
MHSCSHVNTYTHIFYAINIYIWIAISFCLEIKFYVNVSSKDDQLTGLMSNSETLIYGAQRTCLPFFPS